MPDQFLDLQTVIANAEMSFLDEVKKMPADLSPEDREMFVGVLAAKYLTGKFQEAAHVAFSNSRPGASHARSAAEFCLLIDQMLSAEAALAFATKIWPYLGYPNSMIAEKFFHAKVLELTQREFLDGLKKEAWKDERDGPRLVESTHTKRVRREPHPHPEELLKGKERVSRNTAGEVLGLGERSIRDRVEEGRLTLAGTGHKKMILVSSIRALLRPPK